VAIIGAAGRDFHNFNVLYRDSDAHEVVAFTATQIPNIDGRVYPAELAGTRYPNGIPIRPEAELEQLIRSDGVDEAVFSYSDVSHEHVMHVASRALAAGADFRLIAPCVTELDSSKPCVAICAVRTGAGKSQTGRRVTQILRDAGHRVAVLRHPMPYGDLTKQAVQRFGSYEDLEAADCTIEEREEYEPHLDEGNLVFAGVDYARILAQAEQEADVIVWEGGNNDTPFVRPDVHLVLVDPHRAGHELRYHPGETNLRMADVCIVNKIDSAPEGSVDAVLASIASVNPSAVVVRAASPIEVEEGGEAIAGKRVLCVEDGPTLTHGEMAYGAAVIAARQHGAAEIVDPRPFAVGSIAETFEKYPETGPVLPAMGYGDEQIVELAETIRRSDADIVLIGTPIDLRRLIAIDRPALRVRYQLEEIGEPTLQQIFAERGLLSAQHVA
jgi:predicted GTPase